MTCILEKRKPYFNDVSEYKQTLNKIKNSAWFIPHKNAKKYDAGFSETDFICTKCNKKIKIIEPDLPYKGQILLENC